MISLMPWGRAEDALTVFENSSSLETLCAARSALDDLTKRQAIPGVKKKQAEFEARWVNARLRLFDILIRSAKHENAASLLSSFPVEFSRIDETLRLAELAASVGVAPPSVAAIAAGVVKWEQRSVYYSAAEREAAAAGDLLRSRELLALWIQHAPTELEPHARLVEQYLAYGDNDHAIAHLLALDTALQVSILDRLHHRADLPSHGFAYFLIQVGRAAWARKVLDEIIAVDARDSWALEQRVAIAESESDVAQADRLYRRLAEMDPLNTFYARRLADLALATGEIDEAAAWYRTAWEHGDIWTGLELARLLLSRDPAAAIEVADAIARDADGVDAVLAAGEFFLECADAGRAASAFRRAFLLDRMKVDRIIASSHAYAETHEGDRLPLLELLAEVGPVRGYAADPYNLMRAEDLIRSGMPREARPLLEQLLDSSLRWKAFGAMARMVISETAAAKEQMAQRIDAAMAEADRVGRSVGSEMRYYAAMLLDEAGRCDEAIRRLDELLARELHYRDAEERLDRLRGRQVANA